MLPCRRLPYAARRRLCRSVVLSLCLCRPTTNIYNTKSISTCAHQNTHKLHVTFTIPPALCSLFRNLEEVEKLSELGVLFLLFEMGLELSIDRLRVGTGLPWHSHSCASGAWTDRDTSQPGFHVRLPEAQAALGPSAAQLSVVCATSLGHLAPPACLPTVYLAFAAVLRARRRWRALPLAWVRCKCSSARWPSLCWDCRRGMPTFLRCVRCGVLPMQRSSNSVVRL